MNKALYFLLGVGVGAAGAYFYLKEKFELMYQEDVQSVREAYGQKLDELYEDKQYADNELEEGPEEHGFKPVKLKHNKPDLMEFSKMVKKEGYTQYARNVKGVGDIILGVDAKIHQLFHEDPYIIKSNEFGDIEDYDQKTLILYSDGILADELDDEIFTDESKLVPDYKDQFGTGDDEDAVYIRNDIEKCDYFISKDSRTYKEVTGKEPPSPEEESEE